MPWYESGYRANIIVYTISYLRHLISLQFPKDTLDFGSIWLKQKLDDFLEKLLLDLSKHIFTFITDESRPVMNVTEWCKRELCWERCKNTSFSLPVEFETYLLPRFISDNDMRNSRKERKQESAVSLQIYVYNKGASFWKSVSTFLMEHKLLTSKEMGILQFAVEIDNGKIPSEKQSSVIIALLERAKDEGFVEN